MTAIHLQPSDGRSPGRHRGRGHPTCSARRPAASSITLHVWRERVRARNELSRLDERSLRDIGLTPADRDFLVNKPFWRE